MEILIPLKRVLDPFAPIRVKSDGSGVETANMKMVINPFDAIALEEALRLKEKGIATSLTAVVIGDAAVQECLREALALGVDRALFLETEMPYLEPLAVAHTLKRLVEAKEYQLVLMGKQVTDQDNNQVGQMLAGLLGWPQGTFASQVDIKDQKAWVTREIDGGLETVKLALPAVITADLRLNEPRYPTLPNIMKAKQKPIEKIPLTEFLPEWKPRTEILKVTKPPPRKQGVYVADSEELLAIMNHLLGGEA